MGVETLNIQRHPKLSWTVDVLMRDPWIESRIWTKRVQLEISLELKSKDFLESWSISLLTSRMKSLWNHRWCRDHR